MMSPKMETGSRMANLWTVALILRSLKEKMLSPVDQHVQPCRGEHRRTTLKYGAVGAPCDRRQDRVTPVRLSLWAIVQMGTAENQAGREEHACASAEPQCEQVLDK